MEADMSSGLLANARSWSLISSNYAAFEVSAVQSSTYTVFEMTNGPLMIGHLTLALSLSTVLRTLKIQYPGLVARYWTPIVSMM